MDYYLSVLVLISVIEEFIPDEHPVLVALACICVEAGSRPCGFGMVLVMAEDAVHSKV